MPKNWPPPLVRVRVFYRLKWTIRYVFYSKMKFERGRIDTHTPSNDRWGYQKEKNVYGGLHTASLLNINFFSSFLLFFGLIIVIIIIITVVDFACSYMWKRSIQWVGLTYKWPTTIKNPIYVCWTRYRNTRRSYVIEKSRVCVVIWYEHRISFCTTSLYLFSVARWSHSHRKPRLFCVYLLVSHMNN